MNTQILWLLIKRINRKLNISLLLSLLAFGSPAIAKYIPPQTQKPASDYTKSAGARGCPEEQISLTILSPTTYVGHTASGHPTFVWFLYSPHNTEFRLFEFEPNGEPKQLGAPISLQAFSGINKYSLPENQPGLAMQKKYLWQVSISCPPNGTLVRRAEFMVVEMSSDIKTNLSKITNSSQKADIYAKQGLWYEALQEALNLAPKGELGQVGSTLVESLTQSEEQGQFKEPELQQRIKNLKAIANRAK
ncbi:MAG: DUF928 domain-containing protein [Nostoc sp.]